MDGLSRALGAGTVVEINGERYRLPAVSLGHFAMLEKFLLDNQHSYFEQVLRSMDRIPEPAQMATLAHALDKDNQRKNYFTQDEVIEFSQTFRGMVVLMESLLETYNPQLTRQELGRLVSMIPTNELTDILAKLLRSTGVDQEGNAIGSGSAGPGSTPTRNGDPMNDSRRLNREEFLGSTFSES